MTEYNTMATTARLVMERALRNKTANASFNGTWGNMRATDSASNATGLLIKKLVFAESKSVRTSTIILAVFNVLAALATASSILYDCYIASKRCNPKFKATKFCISKMHPAETFPMILAIGIAIQGLAFVGVQGTGLESLFVKGCSTFAQVMWPALFIVPYIQLVFGLECAFRSLRSMPFQARGKYDVTICCITIVLMLIGTWLPSFLIPENDTCFASLMWYLTRYGSLGLIMLSIISLLMLISALTIFFRLSNVNLIDEHQRIAASRMVYYLVLGLLSLAFVIPWFASLTNGNGDLKAAMIATVVVNLSGLISGLLQLFLRSNTATTSFGPVGSRDTKKHEIRIWGPNELVFNNQLMSPVSGPRTPARELPSRADSRAGLVGDEKGRVISMDSLASPTFSKPSPTSRFNESVFPNAIEQKTLKNPEPAYANRGHAKKQSYSLFPVEPVVDNKLGLPKSRQEPTSIYDITDLAPPASIFNRSHKRDSSIISTATVQIGLRLSGFPQQPDNSTMPLGLPSTTYKATPAPKFVAPSPLKLETQNIVVAPRSTSPGRTGNSTSPRLSPKSTTVNYQTANKTLPPTPKANLLQKTDGEVCQLSPAVYSPAKSTVVRSDSKASMKADENKTPESKTVSLSRGPLRGNPLGSPVAPAKTGASKNEWI